MRAGNKGLSHPKAAVLRAVFGDVSKAALIDIVGDALDCLSGEEGEWSADFAIEFAAPRLIVREDREPKNWAPGCLRRLPRPAFRNGGGA